VQHVCAVRRNNSFGAARDAWQMAWLRHLNGSLLIAVGRSFNRKHYEATGKLQGWKKWETLQGETGLSESTVKRFFKKAEQLGALDIEHGRYNRTKKKRDHNRYRAKHPLMGEQSNRSSVTQSNRSPVTKYSLKNDSLNKECSLPPLASQRGNSRKKAPGEISPLQRESPLGRDPATTLAASDGPLWGEERAEHDNGGSARRSVVIKPGTLEMRALVAHEPEQKYTRGAPWQATVVPADEWEAIWSAFNERKTA
jgi:hypothetical protein